MRDVKLPACERGLLQNIEINSQMSGEESSTSESDTNIIDNPKVVDFYLIRRQTTRSMSRSTRCQHRGQQPRGTHNCDINLHSIKLQDTLVGKFYLLGFLVHEEGLICTDLHYQHNYYIGSL